MHSTAQLINNLKASGERITDIRRVLLKILSDTHQPISAAELLRQLNKYKLPANKTTIYRQLETLKKYGLLKEVQLGGRSRQYELASDDSHHHHLVCLKCKRITDVSFVDDLRRQEEFIHTQKQFKVVRHSLEFFGLCTKC